MFDESQAVSLSFSDFFAAAAEAEAGAAGVWCTVS